VCRRLAARHREAMDLAAASFEPSLGSAPYLHPRQHAANLRGLPRAGPGGGGNATIVQLGGDPAQRSLDGRCKPDGNYFRALPYGFAKLRDGVWLPFTRDYKPLGLWPLGCALWGCKRSGCPIRDRDCWTGGPRPPCITEQHRRFVDYEPFEHQALHFATDPTELDGVWNSLPSHGYQVWLYNDGMPSRKDYFRRLGRVLSAATPESARVVFKQCAPNLKHLRSKGRSNRREAEGPPSSPTEHGQNIKLCCCDGRLDSPIGASHRGWARR
jgi:hypothetical protein